MRSNNSNIEYANHIFKTGHTCGTVADTVDVVATGRKEKH
jgi:hypothetical protein